MLRGQSPPPAPAVSGPAGSGASAPLSLPQVLDLARRANPTLLAAAQHLSAVQAQEITAGMRQNPIGVISSQLVTEPADANNPYFYSGGISRLFERGGKRAARLDTARATTSLTSFQLDDQRRQIELSVRQNRRARLGSRPYH